MKQAPKIPFFANDPIVGLYKLFLFGGALTRFY